MLIYYLPKELSWSDGHFWDCLRQRSWRRAAGGGVGWTLAHRGGGEAAAVAKLADLLETGYVIPDVGKRYAAMLRRNLATGVYASIGKPGKLAKRLTADLAAVSLDRHLRVIPGEGDGPPPPGAPPKAQDGDSPSDGPAGGPPMQPPPLSDAGWLAKGVAYIGFIVFPDDQVVATRVARFMRDHASAKTIIIDGRLNGGGGVQEMNALLPYLYARETVLAQMEMAASVVKATGKAPFDGDAFIRPVAAPPGIVRREHYVVPAKDETRLFGANVFYLTSKFTASAGEHLALALKHTKRATLIGEATAGANHFGDFASIGGGLSVFLPSGRTIDPDTGQDWEGTGIAPDVVVPPTLALEEALRRAGALA